MLDHLHDQLHQLKLDLTPLELAEILWLALQMGPAEPQEPAAPNADAPRVDQTPPPETSLGQPAPMLPPQEPAASAIPGASDSERQPDGGFGGLSFRSPATTALPGTLEVARALRPLRRPIPSRSGHMVLDEVATVDRIAEHRTWIPVLRPATTRWLEVALVVDQSASMMVWRPTVAELRHLLERHGSFRAVRTWSIDTDDEVTTRLYAGLRGEGQQRRPANPRELIDPAGRRLIVVVSDCNAEGWHSGAVAQMLAQWQQSMVVLVQTLPEQLWDRTALRASRRVRLRNPGLGTPNQRLAAQQTTPARRRPAADSDYPDIKLPIVTLEPADLTAWALFLAARQQTQVAGVALRSRPRALPLDLIDQANEAISPRQRIQSFRATASHVAFKLACLLAAAPLNLPVMHLVMHTMLPEARQVHLAEFFLSGLIEEVSADTPDLHPDFIQYDFLPGVRELLVASTPAAESVQVLTSVSAFLEERLGSAFSFQALLADPTTSGNLPLTAHSQAFASIAAGVLRGLGGKYAQLAGRLEESRPNGSKDPGVVESTPDDTEVPVENAPTPAPQPERSISGYFYSPYDRYRDFEIAIGASIDNEYVVRVRTANGFQDSDTLVLPTNDPRYTNFITKVEYASSLVTEEDILDFGNLLYESLFKGRIWAAFVAARDDATRDGKALRIRFLIEPEQVAVAVVPWEFTCDDIGIPMASNHSFCRGLLRSSPLPALNLPPGAKLKLLLVSALPKELVESFPLDIEVEIAAIRAALKPLEDGGQLEITEVHHVTGRILDQTIRDKKPHILHFVGHGTFEGETGALSLEKADGSRQNFSARQLAITLSNSSVRLVILNPSTTGMVVTNLLRAMAPALMNVNIPAVVAMQSSAQDDAGLAFIEQFYRTLTRGDSIDGCVAAGRKAAIYCGINNLDWGLATLYMRAPDGRVFNIPDAQSAAPPSIQGLNMGSINASNFSFGDVNIAGRDINQVNSTNFSNNVILSPKQRIELARLLLNTQTMRNPIGRANVIDGLRPAIRNAVTSGGPPLEEMVDLLKICENHHVIQELIEILRDYEGGMIAMARIDAFLEKL